MNYRISSNKALWYGIVILYPSYFMAGIIQPGSSIGKLCLFAYIAICSIFLLKTSQQMRLDPFIKLWLAFLILNIVGFFIAPEINIQNSGVNYVSSLRTIIFVSMTFFPSYFLAQKRIINYKKMFFLFVVLFGVFLLDYVLGKEYFKQVGLETEQVNSVYGLVYLLPFVFFLKRTVLVYAILAILFFVVLSSLKRGAFITFSAGSIIALYWIKFRENLTPLRTIISLIMLSLIIIFFYYLTISNELLMERFERLETDKGSGRELIFLSLIDGFVNAPSYFNQIFGYGFAGTFSVIGKSAHNDLLEILVNFGIIGVAIYVGLWIRLFMAYRKNNFDLSQKYALLAILVMWIIDSQYQQWYNSLYASSSVIVLGYIMGNASYYKNTRFHSLKANHG